MTNTTSTVIEELETIPGLFCARVQASGTRTAIHVRRGADYVALTWQEIASDVRRFAVALRELGAVPGERVVVVSANRYEWIVADLATQLARAVHVPIHASLAGPQIAAQIADCGARVVILSGTEQAEKLQPLAENFPRTTKFVVFDMVAEAWPQFFFRTYGELLATADDAAGRELERVALTEIKPSDLATIIYTSGTTGESKGVMLSQRNLASNAVQSLAAFGREADDLRVTWLPLSHIFGRTSDLYTWIVQGCELVLADRPETTIDTCKQFHPTLLNGVPYFFEKVQRGLIDAKKANEEGALTELFGGRLRACISGGAPLPQQTARFYDARGVLLLEGYGLTETSPVIATCTLEKRKIGTVGPPIPGAEVRIAADGEVLTRGKHVMLGYWNRPEDTAQTIRDGWLHTGDLGEIDSEGFLKITGRKKDLIVTAGGKNIAPTYLEELLTADPLIHQAVVIGDGRNYLTALIVPNATNLRAAILEKRIPVFSAAEALADPRVRRIYAERIQWRLASVSRYEQVGNFALLDRGFTVESGELTPTLKIRRGVIAERFAPQIAALYAEGGEGLL